MKQEFGYFLKNAKFRAALGLTLLLSYGYAIATTRVSIDSLEVLFTRTWLAFWR